MDSKLFLLLLFVTHALSINNTIEYSSVEGGAVDDKSKQYYFKKMTGATCAYTASWLAHVNLFRRVTWYALIIRNCLLPSHIWVKYNNLQLSFSCLKKVLR